MSTAPLRAAGASDRSCSGEGASAGEMVIGGRGGRPAGGTATSDLAEGRRGLPISVGDGIVGPQTHGGAEGEGGRGICETE